MLVDAMQVYIPHDVVGIQLADQLGIPHAIVIGERNLDEHKVEYKQRHSGEKQLLDIGEVVAHVNTHCS